MTFLVPTTGTSTPARPRVGWHAETFDQKLSVFTGPVFAGDDPLYRGVMIPRLFWKIAAWSSVTGLRASGYLLDRTPQLDDIDLATALAVAVGEPPPLGPFRTFQVPVADIQSLTVLTIDALVEADVRGVRRSALGGGWVPIVSEADILPST